MIHPTLEIPETIQSFPLHLYTGTISFLTLTTRMAASVVGLSHLSGGEGENGGRHIYVLWYDNSILCFTPFMLCLRSAPCHHAMLCPFWTFFFSDFNLSALCYTHCCNTHTIPRFTCYMPNYMLLSLTNHAHILSCPVRYRYRSEFFFQRDKIKMG